LISTAPYATNTQKHTYEVIPFGDLVTESCGAPGIRVITTFPPTAERGVDDKMMVMDMGSKIATERRPKSAGSRPERRVGLAVLNVLRD